MRLRKGYAGARSTDDDMVLNHVVLQVLKHLAAYLIPRLYAFDMLFETLDR
jgi:hypothetical protein